MSRGYICIAQNTPDVNYLEQAYALALSIKISQSSVNAVAVCVDPETRKCVTAKHRAVFDHIIDIPWGDHAQGEHWKIHNKWKYYYMSPYDETVVLDTDMVFPSDVSYWWDTLKQQDFWVTTNVHTYRGEVVTSDYYRTVFTANSLPNAYTAFMYFKKSTVAAEIFKLTEIIFNNWEHMFWKYLPNGKPEWLSGDVAFALAIQILGYENLATRPSVQNIPTFVHMKSHVQDVSNIAADWQDSLPTYYTRLNDFKIGNYHQCLPFHYTVKSWLTPEIIKSLETEYGFR